MVVANQAKLMTVDDLAAMPDGDRFELVHGHLVEREMNAISGYVAGEIHGHFRDYLKTNPFAIAFPDNVGFALSTDDNNTLRKPDVSVVLKSRLPDGKIPNGRFDISPDLAVEVLSPSDIAYDVYAKIQEYFDAGTNVVWLARPQNKRITVFLPDGTETSFGPNDEITAEEVLPGFRMKVRDVFP
jgi:Uma2 family endonuclease